MHRYIWAALKRGLHKVADGTMEAMRVFIDTFLQNVKVKDVKKMWGRSYRYIQQYGAGKTAAEADLFVAEHNKNKRAAAAAALKVAREAMTGTPTTSKAHRTVRKLSRMCLLHSTRQRWRVSRADMHVLPNLDQIATRSLERRAGRD